VPVEGAGYTHRTMVLYQRPRPDEEDADAAPEADEAPPERPAARAPARAPGRVLPAYVTPAIVALNLLVFGAMVALGSSAMDPTGDDLVRWGSNAGVWTLSGEWWRLVTSVFVHGGLLHIGLNMWVLWGLGRTTERIFGSLGFALVYLAAGIGGSFASVLVHPNVNSVGASGAIFGLAGAFLAFLLRNRDRMDPVVLANVRRNLLNFVLMNLAIGFAIPVIDQSAHVGGLVTGFVCGLLVSPRLHPGAPAERPFARYPLVVGIAAALCTVVAGGLITPR
jgi:rhomboid protease GluP